MQETTDLINALFQFVPVEYVSLIAFACYMLAHIVAYIPVTVTEKIPDWLMVVINIIAAKHGANRAALTDMKGNQLKRGIPKQVVNR